MEPIRLALTPLVWREVSEGKLVEGGFCNRLRAEPSSLQMPLRLAVAHRGFPAVISTSCNAYLLRSSLRFSFAPSPTGLQGSVEMTL